ncbi:MAG: Uma2 family endonuclease [Alphaproteobacteria bacterium]|nr:Uma2 family endonuclease [Alphaproteobacteria bacterium]
MADPAPAHLSRADFLALPEGPERRELFDGELVVSPAPSPWHQVVLDRLHAQIRTWAVAQVPPWQALFAPVDVVFGAHHVLQPDLVLLRQPVAPGQRGPLTQVPALVAEVLSPGRVDQDRLAKRVVYAAAGVTAYLVVHPEAARVEAFEGVGLAARRSARDRLAVEILPGLVLDVAALFA